jgi:putative peptide zinc metalloprotease protein
VTTPRARIELLVRAPAGEDFEILEVPSTLAYLQYRPQRIPPEQCELTRLPSGVHPWAIYALKNLRTGEVFRLTEPQKVLWDLMDGRASVQDLGMAYVLRYGAFDFQVIPRLLAALRRHHLITLQPASRLRAVLARNRRNPAARAAEATLRAIERLTVTSQHAHTAFERAYRRGGRFLFTPVAVIVLAVVLALGLRGALALWERSAEIAAALAAHPLVALVLVKLFFWVTVVSHQIVHGLAVVHYGRRVREFGFTMLHGFVPTFFVDVVDVFMAPGRRPRLVNAVAGPLVHLFLGGLYLWGASLAGPGLAQAFLAASGILQVQSFVVSLYPFWFLEMDGYHIVADLLGIPALNQEALHFVRHGLWSRLRRAEVPSAQEWAYVAYVALCTASVIGFVALNVWFFTAASSA